MVKALSYFPEAGCEEHDRQEYAEQGDRLERTAQEAARLSLAGHLRFERLGLYPRSDTHAN